MSLIVDAWPWLLTMGVLIVLSALFSGSEAALFSLDHRSRRSLSRAGLGGRVATRLLKDPERLLSAILFWNLLINMTYFAFAAIIGGRLESDPEGGRTAAVLFTAVSLLAIIFCSEMLPKSLAVLAPLQLAVLLGPPLSLAVRVVSPLLPLVTVVNLAVSRLVWPNFRPEPEIDLADIERAIELGTDDAALLRRERMALRSLVEMAETRVSEIMKPRSKLWVCNDASDRRVVTDGMPATGYLMVMDEETGLIVKAINARMLRPSQLDDLDAAGQPVLYVPWSALVSQVLDQLNDEDRPVAIVVNEFGEMLGAVSIDDIMRHMLAPRHGDEFGDTPFTETEGGTLRVLGTVSLRQLAKRLGITVAGEGITTVAGFVQRHNERVPRPGDSAPMDRFTLTVAEQTEDGAIWIDVETTPREEEARE